MRTPTGADKDTNGLREFNALEALKDYPPSCERIVGSRTIKHRIMASYRGHEFFDGDRNCGYGGLKYDGRWKRVAESMCREYGLNDGSFVLQINCEKGFLLREFQIRYPGMKVVGIEASSYARRHAPPQLKDCILPSWKVDIEAFDLVIAIGVVYTFNLSDAVQCLRKIDRLGFRQFITLASYDTEEDLKLLRQWTLLGTTILKKEEWVEVMQHAGYEGDYTFINAKTLGLRGSS